MVCGELKQFEVRQVQSALKTHTRMAAFNSVVGPWNNSRGHCFMFASSCIFTIFGDLFAAAELTLLAIYLDALACLDRLLF